jgi:protein TonB
VSLSISADIPDVSIPLGAVRADDFAATAIGTPGDDAGAPAAVGDKAAFQAYEVDSPVAALAGSVRPEYPAALRLAGIEGDVTAQFIVDKSGRASTQSIRIISATSELFAESVKRAIPRMRFVAARLNGEPVAQTVQQLFAFRLDR